MSFVNNLVSSFVVGLFDGAMSGTENGDQSTEHFDETTQKTSQTYQSYKSCCPHNGKGGISGDDIAEHVGNGEFGSAWREWCDKTKSDVDPATGKPAK